MTKQPQERSLNDTIELSLAKKNYNGNQNLWFESEQIKLNDIEITLKEFNFSFIKWNGGYRKEENFLSSIGFVVDVDNGLQIHDAEARLKDNNLNYVIITSKSHKPDKHKYHIILFFNHPVRCVGTYKKISNHIATELFPECDPAVTDAARYIYGSPDDAVMSSSFNKQDIIVDEFGPLWDNNLEVINADGEEINVQDIERKTRILCPFHADSTSSAFIEYSKKSQNWFIYCSTCGETFWMQKYVTPIEKACLRYWSYGTDVFELGILSDEFYIEKIGKKKFHILTNTNETKEERSRAFEFLVKRKHINHISRIDYLGDIEADESYHNVKLNEGIIKVHYAPLPVEIKDNKFIEDYLDDRFCQHKDFIKEYLAVFCYTNYQSLPTLIFKGPRGNGKSTFAEIMGEIYQPLTFEWHGHEESFTYEVEKKLLIVEENESSKMSQYKTLKKYSGQKYAMVKKKFKDPYKVLNNMNIILLTNESIPLYVSREELPKDDFNNQFFVIEFPVISKSMDPQIQDKILKRLGHYIRTELKSVFDQINSHRFRYSIKVPITDDEKALFRDNVTDIEADSDRFIQKLTLNYSAQDNSGTYSEFIQQGYLPAQFFHDYDISRSHYNRVTKNLKKRGYLAGEANRIQINEARHYCFMMTDRLKNEIDNAKFDKLASNGCNGRKVPITNQELVL
ncbi:MAG: hypothetical protein GY861_25370 [bacterium]|nr:hypothetical protein [bacterium]